MAPPNMFRFYPASVPNRKDFWIKQRQKNLEKNIEPETDLSVQNKTCSSGDLRCFSKCLTIGLDLDETLVHTYRKDEEELKDHPDYYEFYIDGKKYSGLKRPYLDEFLREIFDIAGLVFIFTAGTFNYAMNIIDIVFKERRPDIIYTREDLDVKENGYYKSLDLIYDHYPMTVKNTTLFMVDDRKDVYNKEDQQNILKIDEWEGINMDDDCLKKIVEHIHRIKTCNGDIRKKLNQWKVSQKL